jgi:hypothetical protein
MGKYKKKTLRKLSIYGRKMEEAKRRLASGESDERLQRLLELMNAV